jgi:hypothetical protein
MAVDGQTEQLRGIKRKNTSSNSVVSRTLRAAVFSRVRNGHWKGVRLRDKVGMTAAQCYVLVVKSKKVATSQIAGARAESLCIIGGR